MARFHINPVTGEPGQCRAQQACPFGGANEHFDSRSEAMEHFEEVMAGMTLPEPTAKDELRERLVAEAEKEVLAEQAGQAAYIGKDGLLSVQKIVSARMKADRDGVAYDGPTVQEAVTQRAAAERAARPQLAEEQEKALSTIVGRSTADGALDLPNNPRGERSTRLQDKLLTGDVAGAQDEMREWLASIDREELSDGWREAVAKREVHSQAFASADPAAIEAHLSEHYLRPHATNGEEVRGAIVPKADGWSVDGHELVHESGMKLTMTPGYASYSGWSIGGPEGWRDNYFKTSSGLYPVSDYDLRDKRVLDRVAAYAPTA